MSPRHYRPHEIRSNTGTPSRCTRIHYTIFVFRVTVEYFARSSPIARVTAVVIVVVAVQLEYTLQTACDCIIRIYYTYIYNIYIVCGPENITPTERSPRTSSRARNREIFPIYFSFLTSFGLFLQLYRYP